MTKTAQVMIVVVVAWVVLFTLGYVLLFDAGGTAPESGQGERVEAPR